MLGHTSPMRPNKHWMCLDKEPAGLAPGCQRRELLCPFEEKEEGSGITSDRARGKRAGQLKTTETPRRDSFSAWSSHSLTLECYPSNSRPQLLERTALWRYIHSLSSDYHTWLFSTDKKSKGCVWKENLTTWQVDRGTHRKSSVGTAVLYVF